MLVGDGILVITNFLNGMEFLKDSYIFIFFKKSHNYRE